MKLGIDIGGSSIKVGIVSRGKIIQIEKVKTPEKNKKEFLEALFSVVDKLYSKKIKSIGIGCPGPLNEKGTLNTPNIPKNMNILDPLKKKYKIPIKLENDANCFALAEANYGKAKNAKNVVCLTLGSGVGSSFIINKKLYKGRGNATEIGHMTIKFDGYSGQDNIPGSFENHCGSAALKRIARNLLSMKKRRFIRLVKQC